MHKPFRGFLLLLQQKDLFQFFVSSESKKPEISLFSSNRNTVHLKKRFNFQVLPVYIRRMYHSYQKVF